MEFLNGSYESISVPSVAEISMRLGEVSALWFTELFSLQSPLHRLTAHPQLCDILSLSKLQIPWILPNDWIFETSKETSMIFFLSIFIALYLEQTGT